MMKRHRTYTLSGVASYLFTAALFLMMLVVLVAATFNLSSGADEEGIAATRAAIEKASVLCYATEGFYPPSLSYIEEHYGVQVDRTRYAVRYEAFASNITPTISVTAR